MSFPKIGDTWPNSSLVWGQKMGNGRPFELHAPTGEFLGEFLFLDHGELEILTRPQAVFEVSQTEIADFCARLEQSLERHCAALREIVALETSFIARDCNELLEGSQAFVREFPAQIATMHGVLAPPQKFHDAVSPRQIRLERAPWGTVAIILAQSAFEIMGVICGLSALAAGNRVILRAPQSRARSAAILATIFEEAKVPQNAISVVLCGSREFTTALYASTAPCLVHFMGSSRYAAAIGAESFKAGKGALLDGEGNVWVFVDEDFDIEKAAQILTVGATRYNGQVCSSVNGAIVHPAIFEKVKARLLDLWREKTPEVGPLLDEKQAAWCEKRILESGDEILAGGTRNGGFLAPTLIENPAWESDLVREGLFGPALWIARGTREEFVAHWPKNRFPLGAGVLTGKNDQHWWLQRLGNLARLSWNGDPSIEHIFEPWGGYPSSGVGSVAPWIERYRRVVALDEGL